MNQPISVGVVGCGYWGPNLIRNFASCPDTKLLWACDLDENRLDKVLQSYPGVNKTSDIDVMLADDTLDAVAVATPVHTHYPLTMKCLEEGKHVLVEKPLASPILISESV